MKDKEVIRKTITLSYDNLESCILSFLYATRTIPESWDVIESEIAGVTLNEDGLVEINLELVKPNRTRDYQPELPLEVFDNVHVKGS